MAVFISYSSHDGARVEQLAATLRRAREEIWYDSELGGGDAWWRMILDRIRVCDVFLVALSQNMAQSKACQLELQYAQALGKPIVPVQVGHIDSMRTNPLAATQVIDFQNPTIDTGIELVASLNAARRQSAPLPDPLPDEPPMPFAYLMRLGGLIAGPALTPQQQTVVVAELRAGIEDDGDDPSARQDILSLLQRLRDRSDVTYRTRTEVDSLLAAMAPRPAAPHYPPPPMQRPPAPPQPTSKKGLFIGAGVAVAAIIAVVVVIIVATSGGGSSDSDAAAPSDSPSDDATVSASPRSMLLTPEEVASTVGLDSIEPNPIVAQMDLTTGELSRPECLGASYVTMGDAYQNSGYTAVAFQGLKADGYDSVWVGQGVVAFPSGTEAQAFLDAAANQWSACAGDIITVTFSGAPTQQWSYKDIERSDAQITQQSQQVGAAGYGCQHTLRREANVLIDVMGCRTPPGDEAVQLAEKIASKVDAA